MKSGRYVQCGTSAHTHDVWSDRAHDEDVHRRLPGSPRGRGPLRAPRRRPAPRPTHNDARFRCQDIKGATNCTDHEKLGVHTCEWCASEQVRGPRGQVLRVPVAAEHVRREEREPQVCHEVDSYFNTCADKCCASLSPLSTCDAKNASDLDVEKCENTPGAATCEDIESAEACLDHTRAELRGRPAPVSREKRDPPPGRHVCEYCASTDSCHEVDSPLDSCATACCASRGVASLCDHDESADIDFKTCAASFELNATAPRGVPPGGSSRTPVAQVWQNAGTAYAWPEDDVEAVASKPSVGVAFSGGGTRSYAASVGVAQALEALGLLSKIKYMSGVSGGSWFVSALAYDQSDDEAALLCPHRGGNGVRHARRLSRPVSFRLIFGRAIVSRSVRVFFRNARARNTRDRLSERPRSVRVFSRRRITVFPPRPLRAPREPDAGVPRGPARGLHGRRDDLRLH